MNLVILLVVAAALAVALGAYLIVAARRRPAVAVSSAPFDEYDGVVSEPVPIERAEARAVEPPPARDRHSSTLDDPSPALDETLPAYVADGARAPAGEPAYEAFERPTATRPPEPPTRPPEPAVETEREAPSAPAPSTKTSARTSAPAAAADADPPPAICWAKRFAPRNGALDDSTRLGLIRDLGLVRAPWGVPLLVQAFDEEPDPAHRRAVLAALALYRHLDARAVFERALRSDDEGERALAGAALADLGVTPSLTS